MKKQILFLLSLVLLLSLAGCGGKEAAPDYSGYAITVAGDRDSLAGGAGLSSEDVSALMSRIEAAEKEREWIGAVSDSLASCYLSIDREGEVTLYQYSDSGVLDDLTNMRSLQLGDEGREAVNGILSGYIELSTLKKPDLIVPEQLTLPQN